jgi:hypothetical protein
VVAAVLALLAAPAASAKRPAPAAAVRTAKAYMIATRHVGGLQSIVGLRSARDPRWVLADGYYAKPRRAAGPGMSAVWLFRRGSARVPRYAGLNGRALRPPASLRVLCDLQPALSQPYC